MPQPAASTAAATLPQVPRLILLPHQPQVVRVSLFYQWVSVHPLPSLSLSPWLSPWVEVLFVLEGLVAEAVLSLGLRLPREVVGQGRECHRRLQAVLLLRFRLILQRFHQVLRVRRVRRLRE